MPSATLETISGSDVVAANDGGRRKRSASFASCSVKATVWPYSLFATKIFFREWAFRNTLVRMYAVDMRPNLALKLLPTTARPSHPP
jgi:hypothetical protein